MYKIDFCKIVILLIVIDFEVQLYQHQRRLCPVFPHENKLLICFLGLSVVNHHPMILHCIFVAGASRFKAASKVFRTPLSTLGAKNLPTPPPIVVGRSGESSPSLGRLQSR